MPAIGSALAAIGSSLGGALAAVKTFAAGSLLGSILVNTAVSVGLSLIARALAPKPRIDQRGIQTSVTTTGGTEPQAFILGLTATAGHHACPPMSHDDGGTPNGFLTYVIALSDMPGVTLSRVILNDGYSDLGTVPHPDYGLPLLGQRVNGRDHAWVKFYDGGQISADPMLIAKYSAHPDRPWTTAHIGRGTAYAILTFRYNRELFSGLPQARFELLGIPLYDPRYDASVGGVAGAGGPQRWDQPATWGPSANPAVMIYNILRGIRLPSGDIWGGDVAGEDLPLSSWFTAMNACDALIGPRPAYRAGLEVRLDMEPAEVIEELAKTCLGQISEMGGVFRMRVGAPAAPIQFITDNDIVISAPQELDPFPGLAASVNAVFAEYPEPESLWLSRAAPPALNPAWEAEDGGRRLSTEMGFPGCSNAAQVAQLITAYARDARRFRVHRMVLPPEAFLLEPLDTIAWTSERNGYTAKIFEVVEIVDQSGTVNQELLLRERDPADYAWEASDDPAPFVPVAGLSLRPPQSVIGWAVAPDTLSDSLGLPRRPAIRLSWTGTAAEDARTLQYELRLSVSGSIVTSGLVDRAAGSVVISAGVLPATSYEARGRYAVDRPTDWSPWLGVTSPDVRLGPEDLGTAIQDAIDEGAGEIARSFGIEAVTDLPPAGLRLNQIVLKTPEMVLYRWMGSAWSRALYAGQEPGGLALAAFPEGLRPVEVASALPATGNSAGRLVYLTTDGKLYRHLGTPAGAAGFTAGIGAGDITGEITATQIGAGAITTPKIAANAVTASQIAAEAITAGKIAAGAITAAAIAAGSITGDKIAAGSITADQIAAGAIIGAKILAGAITADKISVTDLAAISANLGSIQVGSANILDAAITSAKIADSLQSTNFAAGSAGWRIGKSGDAEFNSLVVRRQQLEPFATANGAGAYTAATVNVNTTTLTNIQTVNLVTIGGRVLLTACFNYSGSSGLVAAFRRGTTTLMEINLTPGSTATVVNGTSNLSFYDTPPAGTHTYALAIRKAASGSSSLNLASRSLSVFEFRQVT